MIDSGPPEQLHGGYLISADPALLDVAAIHAALAESYWSTGVSRDVVERGLASSLAIGAYYRPDGPDGRLVQVGLVRVVTDRATFAWLCDVYVLPGHQGRGVAQAMLAAALAHPDLQGLRRWLLATRDAHPLYEKLGFKPLAEHDRYMILRPLKPPSTGG